jgi:DNA-binding GntR family transcriptional regulator
VEGEILDGELVNSDKELTIENYILTKIDSQQYKEGSKIPSENELGNLFGVNRHTVRKAIERLSKLGKIYTVQGKGCYVSQKPSSVIYPILSKSCFSDNLNRRGKNHYSLILGWEKTRPSGAEKKHLLLDDGEEIYRLEILRFVDNIPLSVYTSAMPVKFVPEIEKYLVNFSSLYKILHEQYNIYPQGKYQSVEATHPSLKDIGNLQITEHVSILQVKALAVMPDGAPIEYLVSRIRGDRYKLKIQFGL